MLILWIKNIQVVDGNKSDMDLRKISIIKMNKATNNLYRYYENEKAKISKKGIKWSCKNCFKHKYLELLEEYKMELTEIYIEKWYPYDVFEKIFIN